MLIGEKMRFSRCVLHIGTEKTGTTSIQRFLSKNRDALADEGVIYVKSAGEDGGSQWGFVACAHDKPWASDVGMALNVRSPDDRRKYVVGLQSALQAEFDAKPEARTLVISSEHFHSRLSTTAEVGRLKDFLSRWVDDFEVVVYLRRQDRVAVSHYSTKIKSGDPSPVVFPTRPDGELPYYYDYDRIYDNWSGVFGSHSIRVRLFERPELVDGDLLKDFCLTTGIVIDGKDIPPSSNESLNQAGIDFLLAVNRELPRVIDGKRNEVRDKLAGFISGICRGKSSPATRGEAIDFYRRFVDGNQRLLEKIFPSRSEPLFDESFDSYPDMLQRNPPNYDQAVDLAVRIWQSKVSPIQQKGVPNPSETAGGKGVRRKDEVDASAIKRLKADNHYFQGLLALKNGKQDVAIKRFRSAIAERPDHFRSNFEMARILLKRKEIESGMKYLNAAKAASSGGNAAIDRLVREYSAL